MDIETTPAWVDREISENLEKMCQTGEGASLEFKQQLPENMSDIAKPIAAFSTSNQGLILVGVHDSGQIIGLVGMDDAKKRDEFERRILGVCRSSIKPFVNPKIKWAMRDKKIVAIIEIQKGSDAIYYVDSRPYIRLGNASSPADPAHVERLIRDHLTPAPGRILLPTTKATAARFRQVLKLMNCDIFHEVTVTDLARAMGLKSPAVLDAHFEGHEAATFELIDRFCARFSINREWLETGRNAPFTCTLERESFPERYLKMINHLAPRSVYLVRSTSDIGETCIVVDIDDFNIFCIPDVWHVSNHVGGGGSRDLLSLYQLFLKLIGNRDTGYMVLGRLVTPRLLSDLANGIVFPGVVRHQRLSHWWEDLTDLEHKFTSRSSASKAYGKTFVAAQDIIRKMLSVSPSSA